MGKDSEKGKIREATVSGIFYSDVMEELEAELDALFAALPPPRRDLGTVRAILSPHAGLGYSGDLAALAWRSAASRQIDRVVVLSPLHRAEESGIFLCEAECYSTPLGPVRVDARAVRELLDCGTAFSINDIPHFEEHGVEMQLPFMKRLFPQARLVPILMGKAGPAQVRSLASALNLVFGSRKDSTLIVISSDMATGTDAEAIAESSDALLNLMAGRDWQAILDLKGRDPSSACGAACIAAWLASPLSEDCLSQLLGRHDSSASRQGDDEGLVHYAALAFSAAAGSEA
jgi:AmmeMemoRadiSam system protein B